MSASMHLSKFGIAHHIIDKSQFPRDKVCGDALSGKVTSLLRSLDPELPLQLEKNSREYTPSWGVTFSAPDGREVDVPFRLDPGEGEPSPGYISKRLYFDHFLFEQLDSRFATFIPDQEAKAIERRESEMVLITQDTEYHCQLVLSGEGTRALVAKQMQGFKVEDQHYCAGLRAYYTGIKDLSPQGYIELHFVKESLPGYFWIFPLPNGEANVGIGMLSAYVSKNKINLKRLMEEVIGSPKFKHRFEQAELQGKISGWGLPLGSKKRPIQGPGYLLMGDAASLIDPFTGEGIGNAMISGRIAAQVIQEARTGEGLDPDKLNEYESRVYNKLWGELRLSRLLQKLIRYPWLFNWMIRKISKNEELRKTITFMFEDVNLRKQFSKPSFYLKILFNR